MKGGLAENLRRAEGSAWRMRGRVVAMVNYLMDTVR